MSSDSHKTRNKPRQPALKCKQCGVEKQSPARQDGLGKNCGDWKDRGMKHAADKRAAAKK